MGIVPHPASDTMSAPRAVRGCESPCALALPGSRAGSRCSSTGFPPFLGFLLHRLILSSLAILPWCTSPCQLVLTVVLQEPVPSSSQSCWRGSSAAQPLKTRHIHCVSWSLYPQVKHPHVALSTEVCDLPRLIVLDEDLVLAQIDLISGLCDLGNAQGGDASLGKLPRRSCGSVPRPATDLSPRAGMGSPPAPWKIFLDFEAELVFSGIQCIMFSFCYVLDVI